MFICDVATVGATVHAWHVALHLGLTAIVSTGGGIFLALGFVAHRRARRLRAAAEGLEKPPEG